MDLIIISIIVMLRRKLTDIPMPGLLTGGWHTPKADLKSTIKALKTELTLELSPRKVRLELAAEPN